MQQTKSVIKMPQVSYRLVLIFFLLRHSLVSHHLVFYVEGGIIERREDTVLFLPLLSPHFQSGEKKTFKPLNKVLGSFLSVRKKM